MKHGTYCPRIGFCPLVSWECELLYGERPAPPSPLDALMTKYAGEIDKMYDQRTRGDYSSLGILAAFVNELRESAL